MLHPWVLLVALADILTLGLIAAASLTALRIVVEWSPGTATHRQLSLKQRSETASMQGRGAAALLLVSTALLAVAVASVLPPLVAGAMCGAGVMEATGGVGARALLLRGMALAVMGLWHRLDRLNRGGPTAPLTEVAARVLLVAAPLTVMASWSTFEALGSLDNHAPAHCCAVVYDRVAGPSADSAPGGLSPMVWQWGQLAGSAALIGLGGWLGLARRRDVPPVRLAAAVALVGGVWLPIATLAVIGGLASSHASAPHRCPWCLLLPEHDLVGYPIFLCVAAVAFESLFAWIGLRAARHPSIAAPALAQVRGAGLRIALAGLLLVAVAVGFGWG